MSRQINANPIENENLIEVTEETILNQCESCCYDLQQGYPYKCMYNEILHQYKMRLKKAQAEMNDKDIMISVLKDQHGKMENYCRCTLEDMRTIKVKYMQLLQEMENMKKEYMMNMTKASKDRTEPLGTYIRSEVELWKRENKEILDKIETIDFDVQKLVQLMSDSPKANSSKEVDTRMAKLEKIIAEQSDILSLMHSKVDENARTLAFSEKMVGQKLDELLQKTDRPRDGVKEPPNQPSYRKLTESEKQKFLKDAATNTESETKSVILIKETNVSGTSTEAVGDETAPMKRSFYKQYAGADPVEKGSARSAIAERNSVESNEKIISEFRLAAKTSKDENDSRNMHTFERVDHTNIDNRTKDSKDGSIINQSPVPSETGTIEDLLEIAAKEQKFFGPYSLPPTAGSYTLVSSMSEPASENQRIFHELPVEAERLKRNTRDYEGFDEFEHIESSFFAGQNHKNKNFYRYEGNPKMANSKDEPDRNEGQLIVYRGTETPISTDKSRESGNTLKIEEITSFDPSQGSKSERQDMEKKSKDSNGSQPKNAGYIIRELPVSEKEIVKKFEYPQMTPEPIPHPRKDLSRQSIERLLQDVSLPSSLEEKLRNTIDRLNYIIDDAAKEISVLHDLKENVAKVMNEEGIKDIPSIKHNTEVLNDMLNKIEDDLDGLKSDMKSVLKKQDEQLEEKKSQRDGDFETFQNKSKPEDNRVLETVKSLEKRICKCTSAVPKENVTVICQQPPKECSCKYKMISLEKKKNEPN